MATKHEEKENCMLNAKQWQYIYTLIFNLLGISIFVFKD